MCRQDTKSKQQKKKIDFIKILNCCASKKHYQISEKKIHIVGENICICKSYDVYASYILYDHTYMKCSEQASP